MQSSIPVTVFTGFLGAGKTTIILSLLSRIPQGYKICLLKNEFGDIKAQESNLAVQEMLNGCLCCVLVGQMKLALLELKEKYNPDRVIIETSIITVVDCVNFRGYEDTSYTAKMQAQYTDVILLNKHELVKERELDLVIDHINDLNTDTPKIKCEGKRGVSLDLIFELIDPNHHQSEIDLIQITKVITTQQTSENNSFTKQKFENFLESLPKDEIYRLKGLIRLIDDNNDNNDGKLYIVNHAFGRYTLTPIQRTHNLPSKNVNIKITIMGVNLNIYLKNIKIGLEINDEHVNVHYAHIH
ncbi:2561_t:CDS:2 [Diversispora eburnea]|uniref:2561_t:CDS:1 n=1 Tax=Diversispora eburnea TaxID=1213867 RepID=A0A9N8UY41_9GLOM|nr:2561_t:CDS:2 [Diversispora eburnea]